MASEIIIQESMAMRKVRNANVELLRIVSMLFIIMHHCVINGYGLQEQLKSGIVNGGGDCPKTRIN